MRSPDERAQERANHTDGHGTCYGADVVTPERCPVIVAMDETDEALAEVERLRGIIEEARATLGTGHIAAYDLRNDLNDVLSRVSQVEDN